MDWNKDQNQSILNEISVLWQAFKKKEQRYKWIKYIVVFLIATIYTTGWGEYRIDRYITLKNRQALVQEMIDTLVPQFQSDSIRLENIRTNPDAIEQIARERYYMKSKGEEIYIIKP